MKQEVITRSATSPSKNVELVFVHGAYHGAWCWDEYYLPWFAENGWDCHAISLRGHEADALKDGDINCSLEDYVNDVSDFINTLEKPVILVGHSMGGVIVQSCFEKNDRVVGMIPFASSPLKASFWVLLKIMFLHPLDLFRGQVLGDTDSLKRAMASFFFVKTLDEGLRERYMSMLTAESSKAIGSVFNRTYPTVKPDERRPILVVGGREDWSIPLRDHHALADYYGATLSICPGAHDLMLDPQWKNSAQEILTWLNKNFAKSRAYRA